MVHTRSTRDAALHRLRIVNRSLIAGSVALTGVLWALAANAFPGRTIKTTASGARTTANRRAKQATASHASAAKTTTQTLKRAATAPRADTPESSSSGESSSNGEASSGGEASSNGEASSGETYSTVVSGGS